MAGMLNVEPNIAAPDEFYEVLIETHRDLAPEQSELVNARLILLLANHIGDLDILRQAMAHARAGIAAGDEGSTRVATDRGAPQASQRKETS
ncbi:MAG: DUF2783 domain-containing protein [Casimicrobiaceae bacterium]